MGMQHNIVDILTIIVSVGVVVVPLSAMAVACRQVTGTWNVRRFYGDHRYWAMSILNFRYREKKTEGLSGREFVRFFNSHYLAKGFWGFWKRLKDEERTTFVEILSNPRFIEEHLGCDKYAVNDHQQIMASWDELKKRNKEELAKLAADVELEGGVYERE